MITWSEFKHDWTKSPFPHEIPVSKDYKVYINGTEIPVYTCRISEYPFNTWWPGHQRPVNQTEIVSFVNLVSDEAVKVEVLPLTKTAYQRIMVKPYSKGVKPEKQGDKIVFTLPENGGYLLELDDYHGLLYLFNNKPVFCEDPASVTYYFGPGVYFTGKITLHSNESIYVDKDAYVFGCVFAEDAENIRVYGNGIFDDSTEERVNQHCYEPFANGNLKFYDCKNVKVQGVGFTNSAVWCINIFHCFDVELDGIKVFGQWRYNTDGIDVVNSQRIAIRNCFVHSFDDSVTIKGIDRYAYEDCADMLIENCVLLCDWGRTCELGLETACKEYRNITFRNCDVVRGGIVSCDIQNGDSAFIHDILFEDIRIELESFYTPEVLQETEDMVYNKKDVISLSSIFLVTNARFREEYAFLISEDATCGYDKTDKRYAGVRNVRVKDITVYADDGVLEKFGTKCAKVVFRNNLENAEYADITVENVYLNGQRLTKEDIGVDIRGQVNNLQIL